jgi:hypothetical protein
MDKEIAQASCSRKPASSKWINEAEHAAIDQIFMLFPVCSGP